MVVQETLLGNYNRTFLRYIYEAVTRERDMIFQENGLSYRMRGRIISSPVVSASIFSVVEDSSMTGAGKMCAVAEEDECMALLMDDVVLKRASSTKYLGMT